MWQYETFIHFGYITVDIIGCVDGKYEHNSTKATCRDFAKISLSVGATLVVSPTTTLVLSPLLSLSLSLVTRITHFLSLFSAQYTLLAQYVCTRISTSIYLCLFHSPHTPPLPPLPFLPSTVAVLPRGAEPLRFLAPPPFLRAVHLFLSLSNVALSDDVISYGALYISQHISVDRLRFGRRSDGKWDFLEIRSPLMVSGVEHEVRNGRRKGRKNG